jgi:hypothetical protein
MRGIGLLVSGGPYDVYEIVLRISSLIQILSLLLGIGLLCWYLRPLVQPVPPEQTIQVTADGYVGFHS